MLRAVASGSQVYDQGPGLAFIGCLLAQLPFATKIESRAILKGEKAMAAVFRQDIPACV